MNHSGDCVEKFRLEGPFHSFLLHSDPYQLIAVNHDMVLNQFSVTHDGQTSTTMNVSCIHNCLFTNRYSNDVAFHLYKQYFSLSLSLSLSLSGGFFFGYKVEPMMSGQHISAGPLRGSGGMLPQEI